MISYIIKVSTKPGVAAAVRVCCVIQNQFLCMNMLIEEKVPLAVSQSCNTSALLALSLSAVCALPALTVIRLRPRVSLMHFGRSLL